MPDDSAGSSHGLPKYLSYMVSQVGRGRVRAGLLASQVLSSVCNFGAVLISGIYLAPDEFGRFAVIYGLYMILIPGAQALISQRLVLLRSAGAGLRFEIARSLNFALLFGAAMAAVVLVAGLFSPDLFFTVLPLVLMLPLLVVHETGRSIGAVLHAPRLALFLDGCWAISSLPLLFLIGHLDAASPTLLLLAWLAPGAVLSLPLLRLRSNWRHGHRLPWKDFLAWSSLNVRFLLEFLLIRGVGQFLSISVVWLAGFAAAGAYRLAMTIFGPITVVLNAINTFAAPSLLRMERGRVARVLLFGSIMLSILCICFGAVLAVAPDEWLVPVFGDIWSSVRELIAPFVAQMVFLSVSTLAFIGIRLVSPRSTLNLRWVTAMVQVVAFFAGFAFYGLPGAAWGIAVASALQALLGVWSYGRNARN